MISNLVDSCLDFKIANHENLVNFQKYISKCKINTKYSNHKNQGLISPIRANLVTCIGPLDILHLVNSSNEYNLIYGV